MSRYPVSAFDPYVRPLNPAFRQSLGVESGRAWFVDPTRSVTGNGRSWDSAFLTMAEAFAAVISGDTIFLTGKVQEQLTTPVQKFDVRVVGVGPTLRHADSTPDGGQFATAQWAAPASPTASTPLCKVIQQGWRFENILFTGDEDDSVGCLQFFRDGGSGNDERDASHGQMIGCKFQAGLYGIQASGGPARLHIIGNEFVLFSQSDNYGIQEVVGAGIGTSWGWEIIGNDFLANYTDLKGALAGAKILHNHFHYIGLGVTNIVAIDLTGGSEECVAFNHMYCASNEGSVVNARFVASTTPSWGPNYYTDIEEYGEPAE